MLRKIAEIKVPTGAGAREARTQPVFASYDRQGAAFAFYFSDSIVAGTKANLLFMIDGQKVFVDDDVTLGETNETHTFTYPLPDDLLNYTGKIDGYLYFDFEDGSHSDEIHFVFTIKKSKIDEEMEEAPDVYIKSFEDVKEQVEQAADSATKDIEKVKDNAESQIGDYVGEVESAKDTAVEDIDKALLVDEAKNYTDDKVEEFNETITTQLAETEHYMNQLQNIFMGKGLEPYWIETAVEFGFTLGGVPEGISNYEGGNYYLEVSGNEGDNFVTVTGGNITHAGQTTSWAGVIKDDSGNWKPYRVLGTDGIDQVEIIPPLQTTITNGELANVHDANNGQHYTERGYFALAQHIYNYSPFYANRNKVVSKFNPTIDSIEENKWSQVDTDRTPRFSHEGIRTSSELLLNESNDVLLIPSTGGKTMESNYEVDVSGKKGYVETHVGNGNITNLKVDFYLDDVLVQSYEAETSVVNKLKFRFDNAEKAKLSIYAPNTTEYSSYRIGRTTWYETDEESTAIIPPHSRVVYLGDSWGEFQNRAISREMSRLLTKDSGTTVEVFNDSVGGMTSKWGIAWFEEYVIKNKPTHVIIEFFTNDLNSVGNSHPYNYVAPDGQTYSGEITSREEWLNNIKQMADISKRYGIQPIIVAPALVEGDSQILKHLIASNMMFD
ncbi:BppU family phage baseplate upper protein [Tetragenococcus koreensis]|uniref:BppU family phage baseplate upper protein n=1 Tax=Tetragenococcus koreensis TaxID=290335 RepID=UPI000F4D48F4|nr:BppU family phage baseplate upper protein [Tetragenococcus koreensis]AYW44454.1 hypothetical protein C7K43_00025 [Tetragenococcus koreensis]GEN90011.1 hypothetical protein TKO01_00570 [Tetragenococcus koreensis]